MRGKRLCFYLLVLDFICLSGFSFQDVTDKAKTLSEKPYQQPSEIPEFLNSMGYDRWRDIRFKKDKALWSDRKLPFRIEFFHLGGLYNRRVFINTIDRLGAVHPFPFSMQLFDYGKEPPPGQIPEGTGFAGFRIHFPLKTHRYFDEVAAFLGASYFRAVSKNQQYGSSGRGLAVDTAVDTGEEFPYFTEFWINQPAKKDKSILIFALLESESLTGAYSFLVTPGNETVFNIKATLFFRKKAKKIGIAPLTAMYFFGENDRPSSIEDFRPEVHDCDGLLISSGSGEWIWRPVVNPQRLLINSFNDNKIKGFGLLQRDEDFKSYEDLEARFDLRPSIWITPEGIFPPGHVELVQIPTGNEYNDNIVAFWHTDEIPEPGKTMNLAYKMTWFSPSRSRNINSGLGYVSATRQMNLPNYGKKFVIDFLGEIKTEDKETEPEAQISISNTYKLTDIQLSKNEVNRGQRLVFTVFPENPEEIKKIIPGSAAAVELKAFLKNNKRRLTETWSYAIEL